MSRSKHNWLWGVRAELDMHYNFPWLEGITGIFLTIGTLFAIGNLGARIHLDISPDPMFHGSQAIEAYLGILKSSTMLSIYSAFNASAAVLAFILPLMMAFSFAESFQSGFIKTMLSYPISRTQFLITKVGILIMVTATTATLCCIIPILLMSPGPKDFNGILMVTFAFWFISFLIATTALFISVVTKSTLFTSMATAGGWLLFLFVSASQPPDSALRGLLNPLLLVTDYLTGANPNLQLSDVSGILCLYALLGIIALVLSHLIFIRSDI